MIEIKQTGKTTQDIDDFGKLICFLDAEEIEYELV